MMALPEQQLQKQGTGGSRQTMDPTRHRFQTKMSLALTAFVLAFLGLLSVVHNAPFSSTYNFMGRFLEEQECAYDEKEGYANCSCHDLFVTEGADLCHFAKTCNEGEGIWLPWVFCSKRMSVTTICAIISPFLILWLVLMFRLLGSTAEDYFSPSLEYFSVKAKLPPRFAGVTLLALGNGAADVSATVNAIVTDREHGYQMSLGALTGAAMFVGGVVSAVVVLVAGGVPCRGALVRDVLALFVTMIVVWVHFGSGAIGPEAISLFLTLYGVFVMVVFVADAYHRGIVVPRQALQDLDAERERQMQAADDVHEMAAGGMGAGNNLELHSPYPVRPQQSALGNVLAALSNYDRTNSAGRSDNTGWGVDADEIGQDRPVMLHGAAGVIRGTPRMHAPPEGEEGGMPYSILDDATDRICADPGPGGGSISYNWEAAYDEGKQELRDHASQVWDDIAYNGDLHVIEKILLICELPFTFLRKVRTGVRLGVLRWANEIVSLIIFVPISAQQGDCSDSL
jgi:Ca2+/Na+ antiporter